MDAFDAFKTRRSRAADDQARLIARADDVRRQRSTDEIDELHDRLDRLVMVTEAMWNLMSSHAVLWDEDLMAQISNLDRVDGVMDGRRQPLAKECNCGAKVNPRAPRCAFCGADAPNRSVFDAI